MKSDYEKLGLKPSRQPLDLALRIALDRCPHCDSLLESLPNTLTGLGVPTCPECAYEFEAQGDGQEDSEPMNAIESEILRSS